MVGKIYVLICPETNLVRYVGQTTQKGNRRYFQHKYQWTRCKNLSYVNAWFKSLYEKGLFPKFEVIEDGINKEELTIKEQEYIKLYLSVGAKLTNHQRNGNYYYPQFKQTKTAQEKRLKTLQTSQKWKARSKRHSDILTKLHQSSNKIGFKSFSKEKLKEISQKGGKARCKKVALVGTDGNILRVFDSIKEAASQCGIKDSTHIIRVCKGKNKSGITHGMRFRYFYEKDKRS